MENDSIVITAGLKFDASEALIIKQLGEIQDEYNNKGGMQINCKISDESLKAIQNSLGNLTQTLNVNVNAQNIQQSINQAVKSEPVKVSVEADIKKGELQKQVNAFVEKFHLTFDKGESQALKAELGEILAKYDQVKKAGNWNEMNKQWDNLTSFVEQYATEIDVVSEKLKEATKQSKLFITESQKEQLINAFGSKGAVADYLNSIIGRFKWTYNKNNGGLGWDIYSTKLNDLIQTGLYDVNANSIDDVAKINTTHIVEGLAKLGELLNQDKSLVNDWYNTYANDLEALQQMWDGLRTSVVDYLHQIRGENQSVADMGFVDIGSSESTEKVRNYTEVLNEGLAKIASLKAQIYSEGGDTIKSVTSRFTADATGNLDGFVLAVQKSNGEVENLYHKLVEVEDETGKVTREWSRTQITGSDKGVAKLQQDIARLQKELASFESSHKSIESGLTQPLEVARNALADLKNNVGSVETVQKALDNLKTVAANIGSNLKATGSSFNVFDNAANKAQNFDNTIKTLGIDIGKLAITDSKTGLVEQLELAKQRLADFKQIESEQGRGLEWSSRYAEISSLIQSITNNLKVAQKEDAVLNKELEHQQELREKIATEQQQQQHGYWQGRFEETIKAMTAENTVLKEMRQYYADMAKEAQQKENAFNREFERELKAEEKLEAEQQKRLATARELREEQQHNYWQGRFEDSVKGLTAENSILKEMRQYYEQLNKEAEKLNRTQSQDNNKALQETNKLIKDNLSALEKFNNSAIANNNKNNPLVASQTGLNSGYIAQLQGLQESLANDKSAENVARVKARLEELSNLLRDARFNSEALQQSLADGNAEAKFAAKLNQLKNQVEIFANTNRRATESLKQMRNGLTFAEEWRRITSQLKSGNLDENAIRRLAEDLRNFKGEAQSAGLTVNRFFQSMGSQLRMVMQRWVSLYAIIGRITSAFNELKSVDKILTEIAKSSDVTRESLESLGDAAFDMANKYGRSVTDYLYGVQEFSRAGFRGDQLTGLTQVSLLAQSAGDIETDLANSYVIATNAAYGLAGSQEKLGEVLDRQNYVTNNYALNMTDLANATKIAASQAAQSGVEIDQMTAALATMISTTQQGGEIAARSLRGILMNIQQVKGEVGDGEEDITAESLTKYEKAAKDLGVALKEVKDGVAVLRSPMAVLNDLAEAFNKEADDSIKKANLINAIGGKYRGNQLAALLSNWETYKNILEDFNSDKALGSAVRESQKDVASWTGQVNILKNNWNEFINSIVNSNDAINVLKALNSILDKLQGTSEHLGGLGTVSTLIAAFAGFKGAGIGSSFLSMMSASKNAISVQDVTMLRQYNALLTNGVSAAEAEATALSQASAAAHNLARSANGAAVSEEVLARAENKVTLGAKAGAVAMKAFGTALNMAINVAVVAVISLIVKKISELINKQKELEQQANEARQTEVERIENYKNEANALDDIVKQYVEIISSTANLTEKKEQLLDLQEQIPDSYKDEADSIDLVNGKISENIRLLDKQKRKNAEEYVQNNQGAYEVALKELNEKSYYQQSKELNKFLTGEAWDIVSGLSTNLNGLNADTIVYGNHTVSIDGTLEEQLQILEIIRNKYKDIDDYNEENLALLDAEINTLNTKISQEKAITAEMEKQKGIASISVQEYNMIEQATQAYREYQTALANDNTKGAANALNALQSIKDVVYSMSEPSSALRTEFDNVWNTFSLGAENALSNLTQVQADFDKMLNETYSEELKNIGNIEKAIESMMNDETLSHDDAWNIIKLDTEGILKDIKLVNGEYKLSTDELLKLMQVRTNKKKEEIQLIKESAEAELANAKARLASIKINSLDDVKAYAGVIEEINGDIKDSQDIIAKTSYLLDELDTKGRKIERIAGDTGKQLNATVKALEAEVETIDAAIDTLNDRKDVLESEKDLLQDQLDILNEQKETIEDTIKKYDAVADAVSGYAKAQTDAIQEQIDAMEEAAESIKKDYDDQISELEEQNEERDDALKKEKALADLQNAQNQKKRVFSAERGWEYQSSKEDILTAQKELADIETEQRIKSLEKERDAKLAEIDNHKEVYELQIKAYEDYAKKYSGISSNIKQTENELLADQILGADWREKITEEAQSSIETLFGNWGTFGGLDIAFTPVLKTSNNSTEVLDSQTISDYINAIVQKAGGDLSAANILKLDSTGLDIGGKTIKNIIADVGVTAEQTSKIIRYIGKDGVYNLVSKQIGNVTSTLDIGIDKVHETNEALLGNTEMLNKFESEYKEYNNQLNNLINNEIKNLQDSIDMKQAEIDKIDDEIKAYNKYKSSVQNSLNEAKDTLEEYQKTVETAKTNVINQFDTMAEGVYQAQDKIWQNCNNIKRWFSEVGDSAKDLENTLRNHLLSGDIDLATYVRMMKTTMGSFANGGQIDYTGLAMVHGSKSNPETVFNAADSKKLYDLVHNTPNLIDSIVKRAGQISSFTPTTINNRNDTNSSNISVNIGQVVANNPQELTRNLDTHLDSYFRRKLTMGYVQ